LLLKTFLLLLSQNENDKDIWEEIIKLCYLIIGDNNTNNNSWNQPHLDKKYKMWEMNCENIENNEKDEEIYNNLTDIEKRIFSYRVLCPKSSDYNFNPFF